MTNALNHGENIDTLLLQYEKARPDFVRLAAKLELLINDLLAAKSISIHMIESRAKEVASFREKITRPSKSYANPLRELTDLAGIRLIAYYQDDADAIGDLIREEFLVQSESGTSDNASPGEFGYRSTHFIVQLSDARAKLVEWGGLGGLTAEIQVRTVLQHAWAAISHKLQYKREQDIPSVLRRKLSRLSALFEIADDEFSALKNESGALVNQVIEQLSVGNQQIALHQFSVAKYVETSITLRTLCDIAGGIGFRLVDSSQIDSDSESISEIIQVAVIAGVRTVADLDQVLTSTLTSANDYLSALYRGECVDENWEWKVTPGFVCVLMLVSAKAQHIRSGFLEQLGWDDSTAKRMLEIAGRLDTGGA